MLAEIHARDEASAAEAAAEVLAAYELGDEPPPPRRSSSTPCLSSPRSRPSAGGSRARIEGRRIAARIDDARLTRPDEPPMRRGPARANASTAVERRGKYIVVRLESGRGARSSTCG